MSTSRTNNEDLGSFVATSSYLVISASSWTSTTTSWFSTVASIGGYRDVGSCVEAVRGNFNSKCDF